jgi:hypothetical protein
MRNFIQQGILWRHRICTLGKQRDPPTGISAYSRPSAVNTESLDQEKCITGYVLGIHAMAVKSGETQWQMSVAFAHSIGSKFPKATQSAVMVMIICPFNKLCFSAELGYLVNEPSSQ